ncbi:iron-siderophore ABC transporter substrate-binding protein [Streptomyces sp. NPDC093018]|uniref:iron-siderophore ABC transporter substrate-binding protein n=1 Tax=Streptomyces sp. NPDC093018 TaxID=3155067 RepID=UPI003432343E
MKNWTGRILPVVVATLCLAAAGCSNGTADSPNASSGGKSAAGDSAAFPVTIDSAVGKATITARPERVVTIGWGSQDVALALGVVPVGMQDMSGDTGDKTGILPWDTPKLHGAKPQLLKYTTANVPYEQIAALRPDVILAVDSGLTGAQYQQLSHIAPTVGYPGKPWLTSWQDQLRLVGKALGMSAKAATLERSTDALIADAKARHPEFSGRTVAFGSGTTGGSYNLYLSSDSRVQLLRQLGFTVSPSLPSRAKSFAAQLSLEKLDSVDSDVLVSWYLSKSVQRQLEDSTLFRRMPAVRRGGYVPLTDPAMVYATSAVSVLSLPWMLDRYLPLLSTAAKGKAS